MAIPFLIDTNIWIYIIKDPNSKWLLQSLDTLIELQTIEILIPETLNIEWNKKKTQTLNEITQSYKTPVSNIKNSTFKNIFNHEQSLVKNKVATIDNLFEKGIKIKTSKNVKTQIIDRSIENKAPYHNGQKGNSDSLIYFTCIEYVLKKNKEELYFITNNTKDFSKERSNEELHPDLHFEGLSIKFYNSLYKCFIENNTSFGLSTNNSNQDIDNNIIILPDNDNILEYLYTILKDTSKSIEFIPTFLLCRIHPFKAKFIENYYSYYNQFTLNINNNNVLEFFNSIEISNKIGFKKNSKYKNTFTNKEKLKYILTKLNENLIFNISHINNHDLINIALDNIHTENSIIEKYRQLNWLETHKYIFEIKTDKNELIQQAFLAFEHGYITKAIELYHDIYQDAKKEKNVALEFRLIYCLFWAYQLANPDDISEQSIKEDIISINHNFIATKFLNAINLSPFEKEILIELFQNNTLRYYAEEINSAHKSIKIHYEDQLRHSSSNNNNYEILLCKYAEFDYFIEKNFLPFKRFSDFLDKANLFIEGAIYSYALNEYQPSRLKHFDDYILEQILLYGNSNTIITLFNRHIKKQIVYKQTDEECNCIKRIHTFLNSFTELASKCNSENFFANSKQRLYSTLWNAFIILAIMDFDNDYIIKCGQLSLNILKIIPETEKRNLNHFSSFIISKGHILGKDILKSIYKVCLSNKSLHFENLFIAFTEVNKSHPYVLIENKNDYQIFINSFFENCKICNQTHSDVLPFSRDILSPIYKKETSKLILKKLNDSFSTKLYYYSSLFDFIDYKYHFETYIDKLEPPKNKILRHSLSGETYLTEINELMNLVFKFKIKLPKEFINKFKGISDYYDWLIDMNNFDYSKFNPIWTIQYSTKFYLKEIFSLNKVRIATSHYLKENYQPTIANYFAIWGNDTD